jgi:tetratricopeptide (TPR) repeat protein
MVDDSQKDRESERQRILDEIRRRAEEAELQRLEEEERKTQSPPPPEKPSRAPSPPPPPERSPARPSRAKRAMDIGDRIEIALDRGKADKAADLLDELRDISPEDPRILEFEDRLAALQDELESRKRAQRAADEKAREEAAREQAEREKKQKKVAELVESADFYYQQEKYLRALETLDEALAVDPEHEEANKFRDTVEKAFEFAEQIRQEYERRRQREAESAPRRAPEVPQPPQSSGDVWGTSTVHTPDPGFEIPADDTPKIIPQKISVTDRVVERVSKVRIPVKQIVTVVLIIGAAIAGYIALDRIRTAVFPPNHALLIFPRLDDPGDSTSLFLLEGFTGDLIDQLAHVNDLRVFNTTTAMSFSSYRGNLLQTAKAVGADYFLQLSLRPLPDAVSVRFELFDTLSAGPVYQLQQEVSRREFPTIRREIALTLVDTMKIENGRQLLAGLPSFQTPAMAAFDSYLQGRYYLAHGSRYSVGAAQETLLRAIEIDSSFVRARTALGWSHILIYERDIDTTQQELSRALRAVQTPIALGARSSEAYRVWGMVEYFRSAFDRAIDHFEQAESIAPSDGETLRRLAITYVVKGRPDDAIRAAEDAVSCDPRNVDSYTVLGLVQQWNGDGRGAVMSFEQGRRLSADPGSYASTYLADALAMIHQHPRAVELLQDRIARERHSYVDYYRLSRIEQSGGMSHELWTDALNKAEELVQTHLAFQSGDAVAKTYRALILTRLGRFKEGVALVEEAYRLAPQSHEVLYNIARAYSLQQNEEKAFEFLKLAIGRRYRLDCLVDMDLYNLHTSEEFSTVTTR